MLPLYIPSRSRWDNGTLNCTLRSLSPEQRRHAMLVVPKRQLSEYQAWLTRERWEIKSFLTPPDEFTVNLSRKRVWIGQHAAEMGYWGFFTLDDDVRLYRRIRPETWHLRNSYSGDPMVDEMFQEMETVLKTHPAVGIAAREGYNTLVETIDPTLSIPYIENTRLTRVYAFRTVEYNAVDYDPGLVCYQDYDILLRLLEHGYPNAMLLNYANGHGSTGNKGGCADYRTVEVHAAAAQLLIKRHPSVVKLRTKRNVSGPAEMQSRYEVTIAWKKAFGLKKRPSLF